MSTPYATAVTAAAYHQPTLEDVLKAYTLDAVELWLKPPVLDVRRIAAACRTPLDSAMAATLIRNTELYFDQLLGERSRARGAPQTT